MVDLGFLCLKCYLIQTYYICFHLNLPLPKPKPFFKCPVCCNGETYFIIDSKPKLIITSGAAVESLTDDTGLKKWEKGPKFSKKKQIILVIIITGLENWSSFIVV